MDRSGILTWRRDGSIGILTIDNPPQNRIPAPDFAEHDRLLEWIGPDDLSGVIVTGKGKHFSAGADIDTLRVAARDPAGLAAGLERGKRLLDLLENLEIPSIAAIRGACFGGGLEIALACHIRVCGHNALFAFPEANLGILPGMAGTIRLPRCVGPGRSLEMFLGGDTLDAERAMAIGLADHIVPPGDIFDYSMGLMKKMVDERPLKLVKSIVRAVKNSMTLHHDEAMHEETRIFCDFARDISPGL